MHDIEAGAIGAIEVLENVGYSRRSNSCHILLKCISCARACDPTCGISCTVGFGSGGIIEYFDQI